LAAVALRPLISQRRNRPVGKRPEQGEERHPRVLDDEVEQVSVAWPPSKRKVPDPKSMPISMPRRQRGSRRLSVVFRAGKCISMSVIQSALAADQS
jgi:hypothetical protein